VLLCPLGQSVGTLVELIAFPGIRSATECIRCSVASPSPPRSLSRRSRPQKTHSTCSRLQKLLDHGGHIPWQPFSLNRKRVQIRHARSGPSQCGEADRREVDPPIEVETATWAPVGTLDWWVKERHCRVRSRQAPTSSLLSQRRR
jgi:hypothetical protein